MTEQDKTEGVLPADGAGAVDSKSQSGAGGKKVPGMVQVLADHLPGAGDGNASADEDRADAASGAVSSRRGKDAQKASELIAAEEAAMRTVSLSPAEEREIDESAESEADAAEWREEVLAEKRRQESLRQAKAAVNEAVPVRQLSNRPSFATFTASIDYHTRESFAFLIGRSRSVQEIPAEDGSLNPGEFGEDDGQKSRTKVRAHIAGLFEASRNLRSVVQGYVAGCPYAAWYLIRIEEEIAKYREQLHQVNQEVDARLASLSTLQVAPLTARIPSNIKLTFRVPYGYQFADMLTAYDNLIRKVKPYYMMGFMSYKEYRDIESRIGRLLRNVFGMPGLWYFVGKDAVLQQTAQALAAEHRMGYLPEDVLDGTRKPTMV